MKNKLAERGLYFIVGQVLNIILIGVMAYFIIESAVNRSLGFTPLALVFILLIIIAGLLQIKRSIATLIIYVVILIAVLIPAVVYWAGPNGIVFPAYIFLTLVFFGLDYFRANKS